MRTEQTLDREFLPIRAKILEIAASLDRIQRSAAPVDDDPRMSRLERGLETLLRPDHDRAEQIQLIFSRPYEDNWRQELGVSRP